MLTQPCQIVWVISNGKGLHQWEPLKNSKNAEGLKCSFSAKIHDLHI
jgi:hypothetical protein